MSLNFTPYAIPLFVGAIVLISIMTLAWQRRKVRGAYAMLFVCASVLTYVISYALEISSTTLPDIQQWLRIEYIGSTTLSASLFVLVITYAGTRLPGRMTIFALLAVPLMTMFFVWTNAQHGLIWQNISLDESKAPFLYQFERGPWYWVNAGYVWLLTAISVVLLLRARARVQGIYRRQIDLMLVAVLVPLGAYLFYLAGVFPEGLDVNPYGLTISAVILGYAVLNARFLDLVPAARAAVLASMNDGVIVLDFQQRVVDCNSVALKLFAPLLDDALGRRAVDVFRECPQLLSLVQSTPIQTRAEIALGTNGNRRYLDAQHSIISSQPGRYEGHLVVLRDITERRRAETALRETNERLNLLRRMDIELASRLEVHHVAQFATADAMQLAAADLCFIGVAVADGLHVLFAQGDYPEALPGQVINPQHGILARVMRSHQPDLLVDVATDPDCLTYLPRATAQISIPLLSRDQFIGILHLETRLAKRFTPEVFEATTLLAARVAVAIDNANVYEARVRLSDELEAFSHTVAHDLNNPLGALSSYLELLLEYHERISEEEQRDYIARSLRLSRKSVDIVQALLLLAGVRTKQTVTIVPLDMASIIGEVRARLTSQSEEARAQWVLPESWPSALGYAPWIEEIWANYLSNAIKYGGQPPRLQLGWDRPGEGKVRFWVRDNGRGIELEDVRKLFKPFSRLKKETQEGHGLGLSIVQRIAERLGGEVGVEGNPEGGSLFYFTLPTAPEPIAEVEPVTA